MAHKSIADQILMDLKKEREELLEGNTAACHGFMESTFNEYMYKKFIKCENGKSYQLFTDLPLDEKTFISVAESLGFKIIVNEPLSFIVPKHEKGKKMTPAQRMLYNHQIAFNKKLKECNEVAQAEINRVWDCIKNRDFTSTDNNDGTFTISITLKRERSKMFCDEKLLKFLSARAFPNATINDNTLYIVLGKKAD